jgi:hypothetical protein
MPSPVTTFAVFQALLQQSIDSNSYLDSATKAALKTRAANLPRQQDIVLDQSRVLSVSGNVAEDVPNRAIVASVGATVSRVEFDPMMFLVPLRVDGTKGVRGFLPGHSGTSQSAQVDAADLSLQYRLASSDAFQNFDRSTLLDEVTWIQFAVNIASQAGTVAIPALHIHADQV